jgi:hypothetical protein
MRRRTTLILAAVVALAAVAIAAVVTWRVFLHDTATPATVADALARYRAEAAEGETPIPQGVYVYRTTGSESISALGGTTHRYPRRSTITVTKAPCGMTLRWDVLTTRWNTWTVCVTGERAQRLDGWVEHHVFFGQHDETRWDCNGAPWLTDPSGVGTRTSQLCDGGDATQAGTVDVVDEVTIPVGGVPVQTIHLRVRAEEDGASSGPLVEERWVERETGLPVRIRYGVRTANESPIGDVDFEEGYDLRLTSLEPRR